MAKWSLMPVTWLFAVLAAIEVNQHLVFERTWSTWSSQSHVASVQHAKSPSCGSPTTSIQTMALLQQASAGPTSNIPTQSMTAMYSEVCWDLHGSCNPHGWWSSSQIDLSDEQLDPLLSSNTICQPSALQPRPAVCGASAGLTLKPQKAEVSHLKIHWWRLRKVAATKC